jgi:hypothetical protein
LQMEEGLSRPSLSALLLKPQATVKTPNAAKTTFEHGVEGFKREENLAIEAYIFHGKTVFKIKL